MGGQCCKFDMENEGINELYDGQKLKINFSCHNLVSGTKDSCDTAAILYAQGNEYFITVLFDIEPKNGHAFTRQTQLLEATIQYIQKILLLLLSRNENKL